MTTLRSKIPLLAIFLHSPKQTKNAKLEKRFLRVMKNFLRLNTRYKAGFVFLLFFNLLFLLWLNLVFVSIDALGVAFDGGFSFSFGGGGCKGKKCIDNG
ncbi:hypothetical protein ACTG23_21070 [Aeromonas enteropelogenes]|uniref:hypothetical protein n=1 Tax=Aeromonas enteropelogenes TaxID=29489 RepID=UPI003F7B1B74